MNATMKIETTADGVNWKPVTALAQEILAALEPLDIEALQYLDKVDVQPWRGPEALYLYGLAVKSTRTGCFYITPLGREVAALITSPSPAQERDTL